MESLKELGNKLFSSGDYAGAEKAYSDALAALCTEEEAAAAVVGGKGEREGHSRVNLWTNRSFARLKQSKFKLALEDAERAIQADPRCAKGYHRKALALNGLGRLHESEWTYQQAIENKCDNLKFFSDALKSARMKSDWTQLAAEWYKAVYLDKNGTVVLNLVQKFEADLEKLVKCNYRDNAQWNAWTARCALFVGLSLSDASTTEVTQDSQRKTLEKAIAFLRCAIELDPNLHEAYLELELIFSSELNDLEKARQLALLPGSPWLNAYQRPGFMFNGLEARAVWDLELLDERSRHWIQVLEKQTATIVGELEQVVKKRWSQVGSRHQEDGHVLSDGEWTEVALFGLGSDEKTAPKTKELFRSIAPDVVRLCELRGGEITFSRLGPNSKIAPHCAPSNHRLTAHLGLIVPPSNAGKCEIRVGDQWRRWQTGKVLVFDDSFEHEVVNDTDQDRVVLLIRFPHPSLPLEDMRECVALASKSRDHLLMRRSLPPVHVDNIHQFEQTLWSGCVKCGSDMTVDPVCLASKQFRAQCPHCRK